MSLSSQSPLAHQKQLTTLRILCCWATTRSGFSVSNTFWICVISHLQGVYQDITHHEPRSISSQLNICRNKKTFAKIQHPFVMQKSWKLRKGRYINNLLTVSTAKSITMNSKEKLRKCSPWDCEQNKVYSAGYTGLDKKKQQRHKGGRVGAAGETAQWEGVLAYKHQDLSLNPHLPCKKEKEQDTAKGTCNSTVWGRETGRSLG